MRNIWFYKELIPKYYIMNPNEEDLLFDGSKLKEGMIVLVDAPTLRINEPSNRPLGPEELEIANRYNRWVQVSGDVYIDDGEPTAHVMFVGIYHDQTKKKLIVPKYYAWFVKKDTIPDWD